MTPWGDNVLILTPCGDASAYKMTLSMSMVETQAMPGSLCNTHSNIEEVYDKCTEYYANQTQSLTHIGCR